MIFMYVTYEMRNNVVMSSLQFFNNSFIAEPALHCGGITEECVMKCAMESFKIAWSDQGSLKISILTSRNSTLFGSNLQMFNYTITNKFPV